MHYRCLAVVYDQPTRATFLDGSSVRGRARPIRVIRAGPTLQSQPRLTATVFCFLSQEERQFLVEYVSFAAPITEQTAGVDARTGTWFHPDEPANPQSGAPTSAQAAVAGPQQPLPPMSPSEARGLIDQASVGDYFMVVYRPGSTHNRTKKSSATRPATTYADGSPTDGVRPRPIAILGYGYTGPSLDLFTVHCCLANYRKKFSLGGIQWAHRIDQTIAEGVGSSGNWTPISLPIASRLRSQQQRATNPVGISVTTTATATVATSAAACPSGHPKKAGVSFCKKTHKWRARVEHDGNRKCLGFYSRWDDAAAAVDAERRALQAQVCTHPFLIATLHSRSTHHTRILTTS
jgi:hypothetical protein